MNIQKFDVSRDETIYEAWPDIVKTDGGKLICVFSECEHHLDRTNARIALCESTDRGRTWSSKRYLTDKRSADDFFNCARISILNDGRIAIICDRVIGHEDGKAEIYVWYGDCEGEVWGDPVKYPFCGIVPDKLLQLTSGRMIIAAHFMNRDIGKVEQYLWYSDDNGMTWSDRVTVASDPRYNLCEVSMLECNNNTLVAFMRENSMMGYDVLKSISYDNGETWHGVYNTPICGGHRPVSGYLKDGRIMITYRYLHGNWRVNRNTFMAFMDRDCLTETDRKLQDVTLVPLDFDRNACGDTGYTGWVQFDDGEIYIVNYIKDDSEKAFIRGYSIYPDDILI